MTHVCKPRAYSCGVAIFVGVTLAGCGTSSADTPIGPTPAASSSDTGLGGRPGAPQSPLPTGSTTEAPVYNDGTYTARGVYGSLPSHQDVTITLQDNVITEVSITTPAQNETSLGYQQRFADALPGAVIGVPIEDLVVDRLAGSSGCSEGFNAALLLIKEQAAG